jgi:hypothetical protein
MIVEIFPYVFQASERMSARAISKWLDERHHIYLSPVTIAKALREAERYWGLFFDRIYPSACAFQSAVGARMEQFLFDRQTFEQLLKQGPKRRPAPNAAPALKLRAALDYDSARRTLLNDWFAMDDATIAMSEEPLLPEISRRRLMRAATKLRAKLSKRIPKR